MWRNLAKRRVPFGGSRQRKPWLAPGCRTDEEAESELIESHPEYVLRVFLHLLPFPFLKI